MISIGKNLLTKGSKAAKAFGNTRVGSRGVKAYGSTSGLVSNSARDISAHLGSSKVLKSAGELATNRKFMTAGVIGAGMYGFGSGFDKNRRVSDPFYQLTTGDPNFDNYTMGRNLTPRQLLAPLPGERMMQSTIKPGLYAGGIIGGLAGLKFGMKRGVVGAVGGAALGHAAFTGAFGIDRNAVLTKRTFQDSHRKARQNRQVDGSLVFGEYNARLG